jgi:ABC-type amino acid transport system permease subunit
VKRSLPVRLLAGFARFWWDFLVGDTPELFVAVVVTIGLVALLSLAGHDNVAAAFVLPALVVAALVVSVWRARRAR